MTDPLARRTVVFVIRMWAEYLQETPPYWRGEIECVDSGEKIYFRNPQEIEKFLHLNSPPSLKLPGAH